jgi:hypothetical protein
MTAKKPTTTDDPELQTELGCVCMSKEALAKMSLNPYDQLFICRLLNLRDDAVKDEISQSLADVLLAHFNQVFKAQDAQNNQLGEIARDIKDIKFDIKDIKTRLKEVENQVTEEEKRITRLERSQRWWNIALRIAIAVAIATIITLIIHYNVPLN